MTIARVARFVYVACRLDDRRIGIDLREVERVVRAVEVQPLSGAPTVVQGVVNYHGHATTILNIRSTLRLPERPVAPEDRLVLLITRLGYMGVVVDDVHDVVEASELDVLQTENPDPASPPPAVVRTKDGLFYFRTVTALLSAADLGTLQQCLRRP